MIVRTLGRVGSAITITVRNVQSIAQRVRARTQQQQGDWTQAQS